MARRAPSPTRVSADIATAAASVALNENRSAAEQINYWARIGMQVERAASSGSRRVMAVVSGAAQFSDLMSDERAVAHATIDARIARRVSDQSFGANQRKVGQVTVSVDDDGQLVEISPDGSRRQL